MECHWRGETIFRNRKLEVRCLKYLGLCGPEKGGSMCVSEERLCGRTQAGLRAARTARRHQAGAWPCQLLSSTETGLFGIAIFSASESKPVCPLSSLPLRWLGRVGGGEYMWILRKINMHFNIHAPPTVSERFLPPRWKKDRASLTCWLV